ncbi:DoxX family protein [Rhodopila sp.]|jgi:putative oxidoreductase|uniref:DoxX family protein n=1 Tax=Rhodopila sp. TaxID=2480087 RepID=UPI002BAEF8A5|nr:DoxX family protein [Rhodopila sp.]HVZ09481.1 DoxX family protein [Rhodopila sp.]
MDFLARFAPFLLSVLRFMAGLLVLQHGTSKILHFPTGPMNATPLASMSGIGGFFELICGALLVIGFQSRIAAFLLSGMTAVAYFTVHAEKGFYPLLNGGELAALYCFTFLYLAAAGPGPISIDAASGRR